MSDYYIISGISILSLLVSLLYLHENDLFSLEVIKKFKFVAWFIIVELIVDTLFKALEGNLDVPRVVLYILKLMEISFRLVLPLLILELFNKNENDAIKQIRKMLIIVIVTNIILQIVSIVENFGFYIDEQNMYHRSNSIIIYAISIAICVCLAVQGINIFSHNITILGIFILFGTGFALRWICQGTNLDLLCISIAFFMIIMYYANATLKLDTLTQLLNRQVYTNIVERTNYMTLVIIIDANNFKAINDNYGHDSGDKALQTLANCIKKAYKKYGYCFRLGGDEFCVILKKGSFKHLLNKTQDKDEDAMVENLMERLEKIIKEQLTSENSDNHLEYGVSQGCEIYNPDNNMTMQEAINNADRKMYQKKAEYKAQNQTEQQQDEEETAVDKHNKTGTEESCLEIDSP